MNRLKFFATALVLLIASHSHGQNDLQFATLGDLKTQKGGVIHNCRIGYRTFGSMNADKSNVILWSTWFGGTTEDLIKFGIFKTIMDTAGLYIVAVDALTDGVSSSPSNTEQFPEVTIRDMVQSQYLLLTQKLGLTHIKAVMGYSLGGYQALQWSVSYPTFMEKVVCIAGTPQMSFYNRMLAEISLRLLEQAGSDPRAQAFAMDEATDLLNASLYTPAYFSATQNATNVDGYFASSRKNIHLKPMDFLAGLKAVMQQNLATDANGAPLDLPSVIRARMLVVVGEHDLTVTPQEPTNFARKVNATLLVLTGNCGHVAIFCEAPKVKQAIKEFL